MRIPLLRLAAGVLVLGAIAFAHPGLDQSRSAAAPAVSVPRLAATHRVDFATHVRPILEARCQPCHFAGGKMYAPLPFDRAETVLELREKLFTRLKDEAEQRTIREFLAAHPAPGKSRAAGS